MGEAVRSLSLSLSLPLHFMPGRSCGAAVRPRARARWARRCSTPRGNRWWVCWWRVRPPALPPAARTTLAVSAQCAPAAVA